MSRFILGNCIDVMRGFPDRAVDLIVTDPPYVVGFKDRQGRQIAGDVTDEWLQPATQEMYRVLKQDALMVSFYGWNRVDRFMAAWKAAGFYAVCHEGAYVLAKGRPVPPLKPLPDVLPFPYTGNALHPTQKPVEALQPLIESFSAPGAIVLDPFAGSASTCVAAYRAGRRYIGIEMLAQYHRAGTERLAAMHRAVNTPAANDEWLPEVA